VAVRRAGPGGPDSRVDPDVRAVKTPTDATLPTAPGWLGSPITLVAGLAQAVGNRAFTRALVGGPGRLDRDDAGTDAPPPQPDGTTPQAPQPGLDPDAAKRLLYAQTVLSKVSPLPEAEQADLDKMVGGSDLMVVIERKKKAHDDLDQAKTDLESARDISGPEKDAKVNEAKAKIDQLGLDLEALQAQIDEGLKKLGVGSVEELEELVKKFPETWKKRAKEIAGKMLDENQAAVDQESRRYDYFNNADRADKAFDDVSALRSADKEIAASVAALVFVEFPMGGPLPPINFASIQADVDKGPPEPPLGADGKPLSDTEEAKLAKAVYDKKVQVLGRWKALGLVHVLLFHPSYQPGYLADVSDENIIKQTGQWAAQTKDKIDKTRKNIDDETISLWELRDVPDLAFASLAVPRDSVLGKAVETQFADEKSDEDGLRMAAESFALTVTVVATAVAGPVGAAIGGALQGAVSIVELAHDAAKAQAQADAQGVALDPELAKMSTEDPDLFAVVNDLVMLGMAIGDAAAAAKGLKTAVTALEQTGDKEAFVTEARKIIGERAPGLGEKIAVRARAKGVGEFELYPDYRSAHNAYMDALEADPTKEVGIWRNRKAQPEQYRLGYGDEAEVKGPVTSADEPWELVKHHHPGEEVAATMTDRVPSTKDFEALMAPRIAAVDPSPVRSMISWADEEGTVHYTTFGMDPNEVERYWVRYAGLDGKVVEKRFKMEPWKEAKDEYDKWISSLRQAEHDEIHGASTGR
jgi:hypothetical protein